MDIAKELLRMDEAAAMLRTSETKIYELLRAGKIKASCPNGPRKKPVYVLRSSLEEYFKTTIVPAEMW